MAQARRKQTSGGRGKDAIGLLKEDHAKVKKLFRQFEKLKDSEAGEERKTDIVRQICNELTIHALVEEEIFYPAAREAIGDDELMDEADVEHASAKSLIAELEELHPGDDHYDAKVTVLGEYVDHHVQEEQDEIFPKAKKARLDTKALGEQILQRKQQLGATK